MRSLIAHSPQPPTLRSLPMSERTTLPPLAPGDVVGDVRVLAVRKKTVPGKKYPSRTVDLECLLCGAQVLGRDYSGVSQSRLNGSRPACTPCTRKRLRRAKARSPYVGHRRSRFPEAAE